MKNILNLFKETFRDWREDHASRLAAAISYYTLFSLAPLLVIAIAIAGMVFGQLAAQQAVIDQVNGLMGSKGATAVQGLISNAARPGNSIPAFILGVIVLLSGASGVFSALQESLNVIWEVKPAPERGIWGALSQHFLSFAMVLAIGFLLLLSLIVSAAITTLSTYFRGTLPGAAGFTSQVINVAVSLGVVTLLFALIFRYVPDAVVRWRDVWIGALFTAILFTIGKTALGIYLGRSSVASVYGAAGSLAVILLWVYYSAIILFFGAEFTQVIARQAGAHIIPKRGAIRLTIEDLAHHGITRSASRAGPKEK